MNITEDTITDRCAQAVYERGENYYQDGHVQQINRFDDLVTATVEGSRLIDGTGLPYRDTGREVTNRHRAVYDQIRPEEC